MFIKLFRLALIPIIAMLALYLNACGGSPTNTPTQDFFPKHSLQIMATFDGGLNWTSVYTRTPDYTSVADTDCPVVTVCFILLENSEILATYDAGKTWKVQFDKPSQGYFNPDKISCPDIHNCYALGNSNIWHLNLDNKTWAKIGDSIKTKYDLRNISCPGIYTCYVVGMEGRFIVTNEGGTSWIDRSANIPHALTDVKCVTEAACFALGYNPNGSRTKGNSIFLATTDGGKSWNVQPLSVNDAFRIACPDINACFTVAENLNGREQVILATLDGGKSWINQYSSDAFLGRAITCPSVNTCFVAGSFVVSTNNGGSNWIKQSKTHFSGTVTISCLNPVTCFVVTLV